MSIKYKIALLFASLAILILTIVSSLIYFFSLKDRENTFKTRLRNRALSTARVYSDINDGNFSILRRMDTAGVAALYDKTITIISSNKVNEYSFSDNPGDTLNISEDIIEHATNEGEYFFTYKNKKGIAVHQVGVLSNFIIAVAAFDIDGKEYLQQLKQILVLALFLATFLSYLGGLIFAQNLIRPMTRITKEVDLITANNFSQRVKINNAKDELTKLAQTFNNLLDRLKDSFDTQRRFISNASHELSTPLTSISSQLEVAMQKVRTPEEYEEVMQSVLEDIKDLQQLTRSLLDIAKTGSQGSIDLTELRLDELLVKVISDVQKQNKDFKTNLNFELFPEDEMMLTTFGNANLLYIALKNIIENGCKYSDNHESAISVFFEETKIVLKISNRGDIITESDIQNIFQPFFRTTSAHQKPGFGLGLTLTKRILSLHKGSITVESNAQDGTVFTVTLLNVFSSN